MSRTGVLFSHEGTAPDRNAGIEYVLALPIFAGAVGSRVRCTGRVARVEPTGPREGNWIVAVTVDQYEFVEELRK